MTRGPRRHLKRINAPKSWRLDKLGGKYAPMPTNGPHSKKSCIPLCVLLRRKLKVASSSKELEIILKSQQVLVNGVVRMDKNFPLGMMDVLTIQPTREHYRVLYDVNRKYVLHKIVEEEEAQIRLCKVINKKTGKFNTPYVYTNEGSTFRFCDPAIKIGDTLKVCIKTREVLAFLPFTKDMVVFVFCGKNLGCVGTITSIEKHEANYDIIYVKDSIGRLFATRATNAIVIGDQSSSLISIPKGDGIKVSEIEKSNEKYGGPAIEASVVEE